MKHPAIEAAREALKYADEWAESIIHYQTTHGGVSRWAAQAVEMRSKTRAALLALDAVLAKGETWWRSPTKDGLRWMREVRECAEPWCWRFLVLPFPEED